jgi:hypothetical protein
MSEDALRMLRESEPAQQRVRATALVSKAQELVQAGQWQEAIGLLSQAATIDPTFAQPHIWLGYTHQQQYDGATTADGQRRHQTAAITAYAHALAIAPEDEYSRKAMNGLFFRGEFPWTLDAAALGRTPVGFMVSNCFVTDEENVGPVKRGLAYTLSVIFPPEREGQTGVDVWPQDPRGRGRYNRVCYGYGADPEGQQLHREFNVHFPSAGLAQPVVDHTPLAHRVVSCLLRLSCYMSAYLGGPMAPGADEVVQVWLADRGEPGGEQMQGNIVLYDVDEDREPIEWLREVAHEYGHQVLPHIGYFEHLDEDASGLIGERLFMRWLAEDAVGRAGAAWPSAQVQRAFDELWSQPVAMGEFLLSRCDGPMDAWLRGGPDWEHIGGQTREAAEYFVGFLLYVEAAHGRPMLASLLREAHGRAASEVRDAYTDLVAAALDRTGVQLDAAVFVPDDSTIHSPPSRTLAATPGALFAVEEHATYRLYLPAGRWHIRLRQDGEQPASFAVSLDGAQEQGAVLGGEASPRDAVFRTTEPAWHMLRVKLVNAEEPARLLDAVVSAAPGPGEDRPEAPIADSDETPAEP